MASPHIHALSSAKKFGGKMEDYIPIHEFMDSSKAAFPSNLHRVIFHHSFGSSFIIPKVFGSTITNSDGKIVSTKDIAEQHILEDFGGKFIPTIQDYLQDTPYQEWMNNGRFAFPPSYNGIRAFKDSKVPLGD